MSWKARLVERGRSDGALRRKLLKIAELDARATGGQGMAGPGSSDWGRMASEVNRLCEEVGAAVAEGGEDGSDIAQWLSYNIQPIAAELGGARKGGGACLVTILALAGAGALLAGLATTTEPGWATASVAAAGALSLAWSGGFSRRGG